MRRNRMFNSTDIWFDEERQILHVRDKIISARHLLEHARPDFSKVKPKLCPITGEDVEKALIDNLPKNLRRKSGWHLERWENLGTLPGQTAGHIIHGKIVRKNDSYCAEFRWWGHGHLEWERNLSDIYKIKKDDCTPDESEGNKCES